MTALTVSSNNGIFPKGLPRVPVNLGIRDDVHAIGFDRGGALGLNLGEKCNVFRMAKRADSIRPFRIKGRIFFAGEKRAGDRVSVERRGEGRLGAGRCGRWDLQIDPAMHDRRTGLEMVQVALLHPMRGVEGVKPRASGSCQSAEVISMS